MSDIGKLLDQYREALRKAAGFASAVENLDEERRITLSAQIVACGEMATTRAEHVARASVEYRRACTSLAEARGLLAKAKADADDLRARIEVWRTKTSSARVARAEMGERRWP